MPEVVVVVVVPQRPVEAEVKPPKDTPVVDEPVLFWQVNVSVYEMNKDYFLLFWQKIFLPSMPRTQSYIET